MLFKILHGDKTRISTDITPYHEGYCYVTHDGEFYVDMNNKRVKLNAQDAETLTGKSLDEIKKSINYNDLLNKPTFGTLATKNTVAKTDLSSDIQTSLGKADSALQSYTETDPTVPSWAKAATKPTYTASEVGVDAKGTATSAVSTHNSNSSAHADIREQIRQLSSEIVDYHVPFANKKIVAIGDSIVQGVGDGAGGFLAALKNKYPSITIVNMGVGSTTFALDNNVPTNASEGCIFSRIDNIPADADYIILQGGLNDFFHRDTYGVKFGEYVNNLHKYPINAYYDGSYHQLYYGSEAGEPVSQVFYQETFCGAFEMSLVKIMTRFYNKKYVLLIPHDPTGSTELAKYLDAEARICKKYGFPCIDLRLSSGMPRIKALAGGSNNTSAFTVDETHPNMTGYISGYLPAIERWLIDGSVENAGAVTLAEVLASTTISPNKVDISVIGADGKTYTYSVYGTLTGITDGEGNDEPVDPNKVPTSIDTDGTVFNNTGYQDGKRLSTSKGTLSDATNATTTGFIKAAGGDTVYIGGLKWFNTTNGYNIIAAYDSAFNFIGSLNAQNGGTTNVKTIHSSIQGSDDLTTVVLYSGIGIEYIRVSYAASTAITGADAIVTINEPIE
jgi:lysophospholipase L1-like esterase